MKLILTDVVGQRAYLHGVRILRGGVKARYYILIYSKLMIHPSHLVNSNQHNLLIDRLCQNKNLENALQAKVIFSIFAVFEFYTKIQFSRKKAEINLERQICGIRLFFYFFMPKQARIIKNQ